MFRSILRKSFNAGKWKTLLRLAVSRIKLLRNKRDLQLKQMKGDLAQLLQNKQELTAHIRVEHVYREQNIMATYDIIELFCELLVVRLPIIESQRSCPIDLKEAVASLAFAAPRCADLPELQQLSSLFAAKFGKDFVAAAVELRPDCGVNRLVIEKLSARAPSQEVRLKLIKDVAVELGVDWDATTLPSEIHTTPGELLGDKFFQSADEGSRSEQEDGVHLDLPDLKPHLKPPMTGSDDGPDENRKPSSKTVRFATPVQHQSAASYAIGDDERPGNGNGGDSVYNGVVAEARAAAQSAERAAAAAMAVASSLARASVASKVDESSGSMTESTSNSSEEEEEGRQDVRADDAHHQRPTKYYGMRTEGKVKNYRELPIFDEDPKEEEESNGRMQQGRWRRSKCEVFTTDEDSSDDDDAGRRQQHVEEETKHSSHPPQRPPPLLPHYPHVHPKLPNYDDLAARFEALRCKR